MSDHDAQRIINRTDSIRTNYFPIPQEIWQAEGGSLKEGDRFTIDGQYVRQFFLWRWLKPCHRLQVFVVGKLPPGEKPAFIPYTEEGTSEQLPYPEPESIGEKELALTEKDAAELIKKVLTPHANRIDALLAAQEPLPYPEPGVYWVKLKSSNNLWEIAEFIKDKADCPSVAVPSSWLPCWITLGDDGPLKPSVIAEIGPRVLPPGK